MISFRSIRFSWLAFSIPILLGIVFTVYYRESRQALSKRLVDSGVLALFDGGVVTKDDLRNYFLTPPTEENSVLRGLELTTEDVSGLDIEKPEWLNSPPGQLLIRQIIKHIAITKYLNAQSAKPILEKLDSAKAAYRERLMIEHMENDLSEMDPIITQEEMMDYYVNNPHEFFQEGKRLARHIMLYDDHIQPNPENPFHLTAEQIRTRLENGEDFRKLIADTTSNDGLLGWVSKGVLAEEFEKELWDMEIGEIRGPIQVGSTSQFIHLLDVQKEGLIPFDQCKEKIQSILEEDKRMLYRYKFLGLPQTIAYSSDPKDMQAYQRALLKAAYARDWDKNVEVVQKTEAYTQYYKAHLMFQAYIDHLRQIRHFAQGTDSRWVIEIESVKMLLHKMGFRQLIKLNVDQPTPTEEPNES
ncbi:MAG: peptidylprolyl isomerase [bacterium]|jgi:hypothetical protein|nr:peptidylprolyl isomerase [bacterium]